MDGAACEDAGLGEWDSQTWEPKIWSEGMVSKQGWDDTWVTICVSMKDVSPHRHRSRCGWMKTFSLPQPGFEVLSDVQEVYRRPRRQIQAGQMEVWE